MTITKKSGRQEVIAATADFTFALNSRDPGTD